MAGPRSLPLMVVAHPVPLHDAEAAKDVPLQLRLTHRRSTVVRAARSFGGNAMT
ncbi:hypothetical protein [Streptomyces sp. NPDC046859]|uniref:hypothetical protein n=1 Tax=Streptomyces sp. NPDC046859 TaxID=3155734 RepID=UPI0033E39C05